VLIDSVFTEVDYSTASEKMEKSLMFGGSGSRNDRSLVNSSEV
jgi:hypothetical protein